MQALASDKTFHLKWNNHLQNLSQLFTTIYSSAALADVTLSCRDGTLKAHKLVLSACSPYFEQIFKDNPCQHPVVILKGIPFSEINLLVEFMYKGSVDVQELDLQSLMHTASELEVRGLAYEARDSAAHLLNVNLEYPAYPAPAAPAPPAAPPAQPYAQPRTDVERLKQIHMYQQSMMRAEEVRRRRAEEPSRTHAAVNNILAAAAREMEEARHAARAASSQTDTDSPANAASSTTEEGGRKRASILAPDDDKLRARKKPMTVRFQDEHADDNGGEAGDAGGEDRAGGGGGAGGGGIKVVQLAALQKGGSESDGGGEAAAEGDGKRESDTESSDTLSDAGSGGGDGAEGGGEGGARPHSCDVCSLRFQRASHLSRHRLTHTGERPFVCGGCGRSFARSDKLRVHTKICEREDPTVEPPGAASAGGEPRRDSGAVTSGMVRTTHRESGHLVFTASGDVMLPARAAPAPRADAADAALDPPRRGRGRPRKTPLPMTPKIKKRRGRPPKTSLDMEGCVLTGGAVPAGALAAHQLLLKRRRGRPPKNYFLPRTGSGLESALPLQLGLAELGELYGRPNENYNATNLPFGDFSYLTDMMYNPLAYYGGAEPGAEPEPDGGRAIDVSDSDSSGSEGARGPAAGGAEPHVLTVGDCQIVKLGADSEPAAVSSSTGAVTITPISTVGDCSRPLDAAQ